MTDPQPQQEKPSLDEQLEAEIAASLGDMSVDDLLDLAAADPPKPAAATAGTDKRPGGNRAGERGQSRAGERGGDRRPPERGTIHREFRTGTVARVQGQDVLVEFGPKTSGICPLAQFDEAPEPGTRLEFVVERFDQGEGMFVLSREGAVQKASWEALAVGQTVEASCTGMNKGGLEFELAHHKAFMPAGQVDVRHVKDISIFLGQKIACEITELDRRRGRIVLSRKAVLEKERSRAAEQLLETLAVGAEFDATIVSVQAFGAFADIGGVDGLIHVSDMAHERVKHPSDVVKPGQQVRVRVLKVDRAQSPPRIGLGMKQTMADPSAAAISEIEPGAEVTGRVTRTMPYGAFIEIGPGVEGLVHISEISHERIPTVEHALKKDQVVTAKVLSIDSDKRRVSLSIKATMERPASFDGGRGGKGGRGRRDEEMAGLRAEDPEMRKLRARFGGGSGLKGGIG